MLRIIRVSALDSEKLDIELSNGNLILLNLEILMKMPQYAVLLEDNRILYPKTDGEKIFWPNGPSFSLENVIQMLQKP